ncbi:NAD(P)-dependent alcohol dehydrogenase [Plantactinospora sp. S1510]|uniref:NAD(P)-dependent alcohol dehydrogenase n=1 Tax=Plantactinospora alkalitolerans TaxID=2789879 RepID=A0ABS0GQ80_9ACTN|nr:NAD(P)-dependent alcohol dehydrogenase [Plantactinospora alkalitolerans]MBF9128362.1 NAD(P)-dependent alcohol dehydrogenase [Plantactinospora alkalitolerans]
MKAIFQDRYGPSDLLELRDVDQPVAADNEVLVRVHAAAVNARDWHIMRGDPYLARLAFRPVFGFGGPKRKIRGSDFAGRVEAVGSRVTRFRPGDEVYGDVGDADGAFAEYVCAADSLVEHKPANLTFAQAAAIPLAGSTALMGLRKAGVQAGQRVLINGASGGVGTFAVQIARSFGAKVTGVCSTRNVDLVRSIGAEHVIDYTREDFTRGSQRYDVVFDLVANRSLGEYRRVLTPTGTLILSGGGVSGSRPRLFGPMGLTLSGMARSRFLRHRVLTLTDGPRGSELLAALRELVESEAVVPVIDQTYPLVEAPAAIRYLEVEHARAKVVITV